ncbi:hypothetical protein QZH41_000444 [Actinostola sp. cb2023]|nr:hypothetical protein QZH41_000444 [Actinostola sp. cb2023]
MNWSPLEAMEGMAAPPCDLEVIDNIANGVQSFNISDLPFRDPNLFLPGPNPLDNGFCKNILEAAKRSREVPIKKKKPLSSTMLKQIIDRYAGDGASLKDLRVAAICSIGFAGFLRYNELSNLKPGHITISSTRKSSSCFLNPLSFQLVLNSFVLNSEEELFLVFDILHSLWSRIHSSDKNKVDDKFSKMQSSSYIGGRRACSVRLALEHDVTRKVSPTDVIEFLYSEAACEEGAIKCVQVDRDGSIVVTFESQEYVEKILDLGMLTINGYPVVVSSVDARRRYVKIYYLPYEVSNQQLQAALSEYGHVYHVRRDLCYDFKEIESGVRTVTMTVNKEVPSFLKVMGSEVKVYYRGQRQTCRKCGSASHFAKDCPNTQCFRCHGLGHVSRECTMVERCERCGEEGHTSWSCKAALKFTAPSKVVDSQSTAEAHQGRQQSQLSSPLGFVFAPPSQIWSTAEVETPIKGTSSCTEDAESGTGATRTVHPTELNKHGGK